ncbi:MAG: heme A synthase [Candidatus Zixiibacteriota bacterium]
MKGFRTLAVASTATTYLVIFVGGLVRVAGAGLGCPDWPRCFGRWIPPTDVSQLPAGMDPSLFNFTLAWIEYSNRLAGMTCGLLIAATAIMAIRRFRKQKQILIPSIAAALLVAFQGWQGSVVVASNLEPIVITVHMLLALIIGCLLIYVVQQTYYLQHETDRKASYPAQLRYWITGLWVAALTQVALGTQIRQSLEVLADQFPLSSGPILLSQVGMFNHLHLTLGIIVAAGTFHLRSTIRSGHSKHSSLTNNVSTGIAGLVVVQLILGLSFMMIGIPAVAQVFHMWIASLYVGGVWILFSDVRQSSAAGATK